MGHKANPYSLRLGINQSWKSCYFAPKKEQANWLQQDKLIRDYLFTRFPEITQIKIERTETELIIFVSAPNTSLITGENNGNLDTILDKISQIVNDQKIITRLHLENENSSAQAKANEIARQLEDRVAYNSTLRIFRETRDFAIYANGRINGVALAQNKKNRLGRMPSNSFDSLIEPGWAEAKTGYGKIGITVFMYKGKKRKEERK